MVREPALAGTSWAEYQGQVRLLLHRFKTTGSVRIARTLATIMFANAQVADSTAKVAAAQAEPTGSTKTQDVAFAQDAPE